MPVFRSRYATFNGPHRDAPLGGGLMLSRYLRFSLRDRQATTITAHLNRLLSVNLSDITHVTGGWRFGKVARSVYGTGCCGARIDSSNTGLSLVARPIVLKTLWCLGRVIVRRNATRWARNACRIRRDNRVKVVERCRKLTRVEWHTIFMLITNDDVRSKIRITEKNH